MSKVAERFYQLRGQSPSWEPGSLLSTVIVQLLEEAVSAARGGLVIDIGAGEAPYRPVFEECRFVAIDLAEWRERLSYRLDAVGNVQQLPFASNAADVVLSTGVLEHVRDPFAAAMEMYRVLKPNGRAFIYLPLLRPEHQAPYDFFRYTRYGVEELFGRRCGFVDVDVRPTNGIFSTLEDYLGTAGALIPNRLAQFAWYRTRPLWSRALRSLDTHDTARAHTMFWAVRCRKPHLG